MRLYFNKTVCILFLMFVFTNLSFAGNDITDTKRIKITKKNNDTETIKKLLKAGYKLNANNKFGTEVLFQAIAGRGDVKVVSALIEGGVNVNARNKFGQTTLHLADKPDIVKLLISAGADLNAQSEEDLFISEYMRKIMLGFRLTPKNSNSGWTALHWRIWSLFYGDGDSKNDYMESFNILIDNKADVNIQDEVGNTPLMLAIQLHGQGSYKIHAGLANIWRDVNNTEIVEKLLSAGANLDLKNIRDNTAWGLAKEKADSLYQLLEEKAEAGVASRPSNKCKDSVQALIQ